MGHLSKGQDGDRGGQGGRAQAGARTLWEEVGSGGQGDSELPVWETVEWKQMKTKKIKKANKKTQNT